MVDTKEISIIIPCYNASPYLRRCLDSIEKQTFKNFEVVAIDDLSTDNTLEILKEYQKKASFKLVIISNEKNIGTGLSRNNGLDIATGKYITFVDNDDYIDENYLQYLYNIAINQNVDFAACGVDMAYDNGILSTYSSNHFDLKGGMEAIHYAENFMLNLATWATLIEKKIIDDHNIRFTTGTFEDVYFNFRALFYCNHYMSIPNKLYFFYQRNSSLSHQFDRKNYSYIEGFCKILDTIKPFIDEINDLYNLEEIEKRKIINFFFNLAMLKLNVSKDNMDTELFFERFNIYAKESFGNNSIPIKAMLEKIFLLQQSLKKYDDLCLSYRNKLYNNLLNTKNIIIFGNKNTDITKIKNMNINKEMIFVNIYINDNEINLNSCIKYMIDNKNMNNIYLLLAGQAYAEMKKYIEKHGFKEDIDFINLENINFIR